MKTIDALKRLERAGDENSRATQKLAQAANEMTAFLSKSCPRDLLLPRNYMLRWASNEHCDDGSRWNKGVNRLQRNVHREEDCYAGRMEYVGESVGFSDGEYAATWLPHASRECLLAFAKDIADGLLDEISAFLEARAQESTNASDVLDSKTV